MGLSHPSLSPLSLSPVPLLHLEIPLLFSLSLPLVFAGLAFGILALTSICLRFVPFLKVGFGGFLKRVLSLVSLLQDASKLFLRIWANAGLDLLSYFTMRRCCLPSSLSPPFRSTFFNASCLGTSLAFLIHVNKGISCLKMKIFLPERLHR